MVSFLDAAVAFPTAIFTTFLGVAAFYWMLALVGLVDFDSGGTELELDLHVHDIGHGDVPTDIDPSGHDMGGLAGAIVAFGLHGVPFSIVVSLLALLSWTLSCLGAMWVLPALPGAVPAFASGTLLALASASLAVPLSARIVKPLRSLFVTHAAITNASLVGQSCKVLTQTVDETTGRAEVSQRGASINIRVWAPAPNALVRGARGRIVAYDDRTARYRIEADG